jgi:uncharacterized ubiquitin-like protein YukD
MTPGTITKIVKNYFLTKQFDLSLLNMKDYDYALDNERTIKNILISRINNLVLDIRKIDQLQNRISILDRMSGFVSPALLDFYQYCIDEKKVSLELPKELVFR